MAVQVACRGCGVSVAAEAGYCFICKCPAPGLHASHLSPKELRPAPALVELRPHQSWAWAAVTGLLTLLAAIAVGGLLLWAAD